MIKNVNLMRGDIIRMGGMAFIRWRWRVRCVCWHTTPYLKALGRSQLWKLIDVSSIPSSYRWQENFTVCGDREGCRRHIWHVIETSQMDKINPRDRQPPTWYSLVIRHIWKWCFSWSCQINSGSLENHHHVFLHLTFQLQIYIHSIFKDSN